MFPNTKINCLCLGGEWMALSRSVTDISSRGAQCKWLAPIAGCLHMVLKGSSESAGKGVHL